MWIFEDVRSRDFKTERESEKMINLFEISQSAIKSNAKSTFFALAVKNEKPSGFAYLLSSCQIPVHNQLSYHPLNRQYKYVFN